MKDCGGVWFSKRDAATYFDALLAPRQLQRWFGQPPVAFRELVEHGASSEEILASARLERGAIKTIFILLAACDPRVLAGPRQLHRTAPYRVACMQVFFLSTW